MFHISLDVYDKNKNEQKNKKTKKIQKISEHNLLEFILALGNFLKTGWILDCNSKDKNLIKIEIMDI